MKLVERKEAKKVFVVNEIGLFIQSVLIICLIPIGIICFFESMFAILLEFILSLALIVMAYNNKKIFKRSFFTIIYIIGALFCLVPAFSKMIELFR